MNPFLIFDYDDTIVEKSDGPQQTRKRLRRFMMFAKCWKSIVGYPVSIISDGNKATNEIYPDYSNKIKISYGKYDPNADLCMICSIIPILEQNPVTPSTKFNQGAYPDLVNEYTNSFYDGETDDKPITIRLIDRVYIKECINRWQAFLHISDASRNELLQRNKTVVYKDPTIIDKNCRSFFESYYFDRDKWYQGGPAKLIRNEYLPINQTDALTYWLTNYKRYEIPFFVSTNVNEYTCYLQGSVKNLDAIRKHIAYQTGISVSDVFFLFFDDKCVHVGVSEYDRYFSKRETIGNFMNGVVDFLQLIIDSCSTNGLYDIGTGENYGKKAGKNVSQLIDDDGLLQQNDLWYDLNHTIDRSEARIELLQLLNEYLIDVSSPVYDLHISSSAPPPSAPRHRKYT